MITGSKKNINVSVDNIISLTLILTSCIDFLHKDRENGMLIQMREIQKCEMGGQENIFKYKIYKYCKYYKNVIVYGNSKNDP